LLPDAALFVDRKSVTALHYRDLNVSQRNVNFIEEEGAAGDTVVVGNTWRFVNKNGGPDRRFNNNRQLPVCLYNQLDLTSNGGLNGRLHLSKPDAGAIFVKVTETLARFLDSDASLKPVKSYRRPASWPTAVFVPFAIAFMLGLIAIGAQPSSPQIKSSERSASAALTDEAPLARSAPAIADSKISAQVRPAEIPLPHLRPKRPQPLSPNAPMVLQP
jgi:hypothetical protein